jgi:hypothetical protein
MEETLRWRRGRDPLPVLIEIKAFGETFAIITLVMERGGSHDY